MSERTESGCRLNPRVGGVTSGKPHNLCGLCFPSVKGMGLNQLLSETLFSPSNLCTWVGHHSGHKFLLDHIRSFLTCLFSYLFFASCHVKIFHQTATPEAEDLQKVPPLLTAKYLPSLPTACMDVLLLEIGLLWSPFHK